MNPRLPDGQQGQGLNRTQTLNPHRAILQDAAAQAAQDTANAVPSFQQPRFRNQTVWFNNSSPSSGPQAAVDSTTPSSSIANQRVSGIGNRGRASAGRGGLPHNHEQGAFAEATQHRGRGRGRGQGMARGNDRPNMNRHWQPRVETEDQDEGQTYPGTVNFLDGNPHSHASPVIAGRRYQNDVSPLVNRAGWPNRVEGPGEAYLSAPPQMKPNRARTAGVRGGFVAPNAPDRLVRRNDFTEDDDYDELEDSDAADSRTQPASQTHAPFQSFGGIAQGQVDRSYQPAGIRNDSIASTPAPMSSFPRPSVPGTPYTNLPIPQSISPAYPRPPFAPQGNWSVPPAYTPSGISVPQPQTQAQPRPPSYLPDSLGDQQSSRPLNHVPHQPILPQSAFQSHPIPAFSHPLNRSGNQSDNPADQFSAFSQPFHLQPELPSQPSPLPRLSNAPPDLHQSQQTGLYSSNDAAPGQGWPGTGQSAMFAARRPPSNDYPQNTTAFPGGLTHPSTFPARRAENSAFAAPFSLLPAASTSSFHPVSSPDPAPLASSTQPSLLSRLGARVNPSPMLAQPLQTFEEDQENPDDVLGEEEDWGATEERLEDEQEDAMDGEDVDEYEEADVRDRQGAHGGDEAHEEEAPPLAETHDVRSEKLEHKEGVLAEERVGVHSSSQPVPPTMVMEVEDVRRVRDEAKAAALSVRARKMAAYSGLSIYQQFAQMKEDRIREKLDDFANKRLQDPDVAVRLDQAITVVGTCYRLCPDYEIVQRQVTGGIERWEKDPLTGEVDPERCVSEYKRPSAGEGLGKTILPSDLRPPAMLRTTVEYLLDTFLTEDAFEEKYSFISNRLRQITQELQMQQETGADAVYCHERIIRFHIYAARIMSDLDQLNEKLLKGTERWEEFTGNKGVSYNGKLEGDRLVGALVSLIRFYDDNRKGAPSVRFETPNEPEFRAYQLFVFPDRGTIQKVNSLPKHVVENPWLRFTKELLPYTQLKGKGSKGDPLLFWTHFFSVLRRPDFPFFLAVEFERRFVHVRKAALWNMCPVYHPRHKGIPVRTVMEWLAFDSPEETVNFARRCRIAVDVSDGVQRLVINKTIKFFNFSSANMIRPRTSRVVDAQRGSLSLSQLLQGWRTHGWLPADEPRQTVEQELVLEGERPQPKKTSKGFQTMDPLRFQPLSNAAASSIQYHSSQTRTKDQLRSAQFGQPHDAVRQVQTRIGSTESHPHSRPFKPPLNSGAFTTAPATTSDQPLMSPSALQSEGLRWHKRNIITSPTTQSHGTVSSPGAVLPQQVAGRPFSASDSTRNAAFTTALSVSTIFDGRIPTAAFVPPVAQPSLPIPTPQDKIVSGGPFPAFDRRFNEHSAVQSSLLARFPNPFASSSHHPAVPAIGGEAHYSDGGRQHDSTPISHPDHTTLTVRDPTASLSHTADSSRPPVSDGMLHRSAEFADLATKSRPDDGDNILMPASVAAIPISTLTQPSEPVPVSSAQVGAPFAEGFSQQSTHMPSPPLHLRNPLTALAQHPAVRPVFLPAVQQTATFTSSAAFSQRSHEQPIRQSSPILQLSNSSGGSAAVLPLNSPLPSALPPSAQSTSSPLLSQGAASKVRPLPPPRPLSHTSPQSPLPAVASVVIENPVFVERARSGSESFPRAQIGMGHNIEVPEPLTTPPAPLPEKRRGYGLFSPLPPEGLVLSFSSEEAANGPAQLDDKLTSPSRLAAFKGQVESGSVPLGHDEITIDPKAKDPKLHGTPQAPLATKQRGYGLFSPSPPPVLPKTVPKKVTREPSRRGDRVSLSAPVSNRATSDVKSLGSSKQAEVGARFNLQLELPLPLQVGQAGILSSSAQPAGGAGAKSSESHGAEAGSDRCLQKVPKADDSRRSQNDEYRNLVQETKRAIQDAGLDTMLSGQMLPPDRPGAHYLFTEDYHTVGNSFDKEYAQKKAYEASGTLLRLLQDKVHGQLAPNDNLPEGWRIYLSTPSASPSTSWLREKLGTSVERKCEGYQSVYEGSLCGTDDGALLPSPGLVIFESSLDLSFSASDCARLNAVVKSMPVIAVYRPSLLVIYRGSNYSSEYVNTVRLKIKEALKLDKLKLKYDFLQMAIALLGPVEQDEEILNRAIREIKLDVVGRHVKIITTREYAETLLDKWHRFIPTAIGLVEDVQTSIVVLKGLLGGLNAVVKEIWAISSHSDKPCHSVLPSFEPGALANELGISHALFDYVNQGNWADTDEIQALKTELFRSHLQGKAVPLQLVLETIARTFIATWEADVHIKEDLAGQDLRRKMGTAFESILEANQVEMEKAVKALSARQATQKRTREVDEAHEVGLETSPKKPRTDVQATNALSQTYDPNSADVVERWRARIHCQRDLCADKTASKRGREDDVAGETESSKKPKKGEQPQPANQTKDMSRPATLARLKALIGSVTRTSNNPRPER